jgi:SAM-dependent methyltransferase
MFEHDESLQRSQGICSVCGSKDRQRLLALFLERETKFFTKGGSVLDIGPTENFSHLCKRNKKIKYLSIDKVNNRAMKQMSLTQLEIPDESFDYIICSYVLEHIIEDMNAISEMLRVLKKNGTCLIMVPKDIKRKETLEKILKKSTLEQRKKLFGHPDHVRIYGNDFFHRLKKKGFIVKSINYIEQISRSERKQFGLSKIYNTGTFITDMTIYLCTK